MIKLPVYNQQGKQIKKLELDPNVFDGKVNQGVLYQTVLMYRANRRKGLACTKTRKEVSGGGSRPWRQKGTGRARVSSIRSPLWRKGGTTFGPHPRDFGFKLPKKIKVAALKSSLNAKLDGDNLVIVDELNIEAPKTKKAVEVLSKLKVKDENLLLTLDNLNDNLKLSFQNIEYLDIIRASDLNAFNVLNAKKIIVTLNALKILVDRIKGGLNLKAAPKE